MIAVLVIVHLLRQNRTKGWVGEKVTSAGMWAFLDKNQYHRINDLIIPASNGTTQIDHVIISKYGLFVVETKNIRGWIFGDPGDDKWTQSIYGRKSQFQNPLRQNYRHVKCLAEYLGIDEGIINPIVFFIGDCKFKTPMPTNVLNSGLIPYIKGFRQEVLDPEQMAEIKLKLSSLVQDPSLNRQTHMASLENRYKSITTCPKCGGQLVERIAKKGPSVGSAFLGCTNYPRCTYTKKR